MEFLREVQGVRYELFDRHALDEMALLVAEAFTRSEPMTVAQGITSKEMVYFVKLLGSKAEQEELTVLARDLETGQVIGALVNDDLASMPREGMEYLGEKIEPVLALLSELDAQYKQGKTIGSGEYLHLFMAAVANQHKGKKVAQNLTQACLENGIRKGYKTAVAEATGLISQHILRKLGFVERFKIPYKTFTYQGRRVFESIEGPTHAILMDKTLV